MRNFFSRSNKVRKVISSFVVIFALLFLNSCFLLFIEKPVDEDSGSNQTDQALSTQSGEVSYKKYEMIDISSLKKVDEYARSVPSSQAQNVETLTHYLLKPAKSELEKFRAIWIWITDNIAYDVDGYFSGSITSYDAQTAFSKRVGVCSGYASLFKQMADIAGLECQVITGYAKGYNYSYEITTLPADNHAWISLKINGKWYLADPTWGAGYVDYSKKFIKDYEEFYFCTNPSFLIYSHFPNDPNWQLLESAVDADTFIKLVRTWPIFFKLGFSNLSHPYGRIETNKVNLEIKIQADIPGTKILGGLYFAENGKEAAKVNCQKQINSNVTTWSIFVNFPGKGKYILYIFAGFDRDTEFAGALEYYIEVK